MRHSWWQSLVHRHWRRAGASGRRSGPARQFRPAVMALEDRVVPAAYHWAGSHGLTGGWVAEHGFQRLTSLVRIAASGSPFGVIAEMKP